MEKTEHTDSVEASEKEYQRQLAIAISVGEKEPHISAFIGAWDMYDGLMNDCFMTSKDRAQMRKMLTTLQAQTSQQVENWHKESFDRGLELGQQQVEEAVLQADATGAYHSGYLAGKAEVEEAVKKERERMKTVITQVRKKYGLDIPDEVDSIDYDTGSDVADDIEEALTPNHQD